MEYYNLINSKYIELVKAHTITPCFKLELLDDYENAYQNLTSYISAESSGSISATYQQGVQKTITVSFFDPKSEFIPDPNNQNFWIGRKFKVYLGLMANKYYLAENPLIYADTVDSLLAYYQNQQNNDNLENDGIFVYAEDDIKHDTDIYWFSKGVYIISSIDASHNLAERLITISGVDKFGLFTADTGYCEMITNYVIKKGTTIEDAIINMLIQDRGNGKPLDPLSPIIDPIYMGVQLPYEIQKGAGAYLGDIITELSTMYKADVYYDNDGRFNFRRAMLGDENMQLPFIWEFSDAENEYISSSLNYNLTDAINTIFVVGDNPNAAIAPEAFRQNTNPASPLNVENNGIKSRLYTSSIIQTRTEAEDYAEYMLNQFSRIQQSLSLTTSFIPHLDINKGFILTDQFYKMTRENFIIQSITFPLGLGTLSISGCNIQELPTY